MCGHVRGGVVVVVTRSHLGGMNKGLTSRLGPEGSQLLPQTKTDVLPQGGDTGVLYQRGDTGVLYQGGGTGVLLQGGGTGVPLQGGGTVVHVQGDGTGVLIQGGGMSHTSVHYNRRSSKRVDTLGIHCRRLY